MANQEHYVEFAKGRIHWNKWREENQNIKPDLSDINLWNGKSNLGNKSSSLFGNQPDYRNLNLSKSNLRNSNLSGLDLENSDFSDSDMFHASFWHSNLINCNFSKSDTQGVDFDHCNLLNANFCQAYMLSSSFFLSDLSNANFSKSNVTHAHFKRANFHNTEFNEATFGYTSLSEINLCHAKSLANTLHSAPSSIGMDTIQISYNTLNKTPFLQSEIENFLEKAGVQKEFIPYFRDLISKPIEFYSCFISYSHSDRLFARKLYSILTQKDIRCWLDEHQLLPGDDIYDQIDKGIKLWDKVLLLCSKSSLTSWWVDNEILSAFNKEQSLFKKYNKKTLSLVPINLDDYLFCENWERGYKKQILSRLAADFVNWESEENKFNLQIEKLISALRADDLSRPKPPNPKL